MVIGNKTKIGITLPPPIPPPAPLELFFPYASNRVRELNSSKATFAHYSRLDGIVGILQNREVWMRRASTMNDLSEIRYGFECLKSTLANTTLVSSLSSFLQRYDRNLVQQIFAQVESLFLDDANSVFLACLTEHGGVGLEDRSHERELGRLSMWRGYGGDECALISLNTSPFFQETDGLSVFTSPVCYGGQAKFDQRFCDFVNNLKQYTSYFDALGAENARQYLLYGIVRAFEYAVLSFKHPGFSEEREWRVLFSEGRDTLTGLQHARQTFNRMSDDIYKIPLRNNPDVGLFGIEPNELVLSILIGPSYDQAAARRKLLVAMADAGIENPEKKVAFSGIPIRH